MLNLMRIAQHHYCTHIQAKLVLGLVPIQLAYGGRTPLRMRTNKLKKGGKTLYPYLLSKG